MPALYLDSNVVIALVEEDLGRKSALVVRLTVLGEADGLCVVSDLVRLECRVKPLAAKDPALLGDYDAYFASSDVTVFTPTQATYDRATDIRARYRYETADALHLAAAIEAGCDVFVTADRRLAGFTGLPVVLVQREQTDRDPTLPTDGNT
jgi:predicted nucleic acid-binding protein